MPSPPASAASDPAAIASPEGPTLIFADDPARARAFARMRRRWPKIFENADHPLAEPLIDWRARRRIRARDAAAGFA